ncbi:MAG: DsrE family protein [Phycisphaerae bacterium]|nr:DsrE family protein [Phycisphaerae bacterium]MDD5381162.1 DsrE family protein [Phycisphaerae bacterium]
MLIVSGPESFSRAVVGFAFAAAAAISGIKVLTVLAGEAAGWVKKDEPRAQEKLTGFSSVSEYMGIIIENDSNICLCSACAEHCFSEDEINHKILSEICYSGLTEFAIDASKNSVKTIVF